VPSEPFLGEVMVVALPYAPAGWALCDGQVLLIAQHRALFSILGTRYGGDGTRTFALPRLAGAVAVGSGQGPGLEARTVGEAGGTPTYTLQANELPAHIHRLRAVVDPGDKTAPSDSRSLARATRNAYVADRQAAPAPMAPQAIWPSGGGKRHENMPPSLVLIYVIALEGIFPPRS
jgi:microcystin-dependent protein